MALPDGVRALLQLQDGAAHLQQLIARGMTADMCSHRVRTGQWQRPLPSVYVLGASALSERQRLRAALLYAGPEAQLTAGAACQLHGLDLRPRSPQVAVLMPRRVQRASRGFVRVIRTSRADVHAVVRAGFPCTSLPRSVAEEARLLGDLMRVRALVTQSVQRELTTPALLAAECEAGQQRGSALLRRAIADCTDGARSPWEAVARDLIAASRLLPQPEANALLSIGGVRYRPDLLWRDVLLVVEIDSREFHFLAADWARTMNRHNALAQAGCTVLHIRPSQLRDDPAGVLALIEATYLRLVRQAS